MRQQQLPHHAVHGNQKQSGHKWSQSMIEAGNIIKKTSSCAKILIGNEHKQAITKYLKSKNKSKTNKENCC